MLLGHLNATEETDLERIGVIGAPGATVADFLGHTLAADRVIAGGAGHPQRRRHDASAGLHRRRGRGLISSVTVQTSLTNKPLNVNRLTVAPIAASR